MGSSILRCAVVLCWIAASTSFAWGQAPKSDKKPKAAGKSEKAGGEVVADPETTALLDKVDASAYTLEGAGVKKASCKGEVEMQLPNQPPVKGEFRYEWDAASNDKKGKFTFSDPAMEAQLKGMNMLPNLDSVIRRGNWRETYAGCRLASKKEGGNTVIQVVEGRTKEGITSVTLNDQGMPVEAAMGGANPGAPAAGMKITNTRFGDKFAMSKATILMNGQPLGEITCEYVKVMDFNAPAKMSTNISMLGQNISGVSKFSDWKLDGAASPEKDSEKKADSPSAKPKKEKAKAK